MARTFSVNCVQISAHRGPMAAERLNISTRWGSIPILPSRVFTWSILRAANLLPSR
jgi:hypothetical protein